MKIMREARGRNQSGDSVSALSILTFTPAHSGNGFPKKLYTHPEIDKAFIKIFQAYRQAVVKQDTK
jgi:hypothetical protein